MCTVHLPTHWLKQDCWKHVWLVRGLGHGISLLADCPAYPADGWRSSVFLHLTTITGVSEEGNTLLPQIPHTAAAAGADETRNMQHTTYNVHDMQHITHTYMHTCRRYMTIYLRERLAS